MNELGKEYGTALFMLACEEEKQKEFYDGLGIIASAFKEEPEYIELLSCPGVAMGQRLSAIDAAFADRIPEGVLSYLKLLCEKGRISCFFDSVKEYKALLDETERISRVKVTSAVELTDEEKQKLRIRLEAAYGRRVELEYSIDEDLLGGMVVDIDGKVIDSSLRYRLREVKEVMNT